MGPVEVKGMVLGLAVVAGAFCIWLGYRLYIKGVLEKGTGEGKAPGFSVTWKDYGPGVVFALFGAAVIVFAVNRGLSTTETRTVRPDGTIQTTDQATGAPGPSVVEEVSVSSAAEYRVETEAAIAAAASSDAAMAAEGDHQE